MHEYHKIQTVWQRDPETKYKTLLEDAWATREFQMLQYCHWQFTEKIDGTNIRVIWDGERVRFGGKTDRAQIPARLVERLQELFLPADKFRPNEPITLYGEGFGAKIQKGGGNYIPDGVDFCLFDAWAGMWLERGALLEIGEDMGIMVAPLVGGGSLRDMVEYTRKSFPSYWGDFRAEGIVARPVVELNDRRGRRIITKVKCKDFREETSNA